MQPIPQPQNNDDRPRTRIAIITDVGFKANGVTAYTPEEIQSIMEDSTPWVLIQTVPHREGNQAYIGEILSTRRDKIIAWGVSEVSPAPKLT